MGTADQGIAAGPGTAARTAAGSPTAAGSRAAAEQASAAAASGAYLQDDDNKLICRNKFGQSSARDSLSYQWPKVMNKFCR